MSKFFISYSHDDREFAEKLRCTIRAIDSAHEVFLDLYEIPANAQLKDTIKERIETCDCFLLILSPKALKSPWVKFETEVARQNEIDTGLIKIFPIRIDRKTTIDKIPVFLKGRLAVTFSNDDTSYPAEFYRLMHGIDRRPTHYAIRQKIAPDPESGYLVDLWVEADKRALAKINFVEYRFDNEFESSEVNTHIDGAVHVETSSKRQFAVRELWTSEPITIFVVIYLKNTRQIDFKVRVDVGQPVN